MCENGLLFKLELLRHSRELPSLVPLDTLQGNRMNEFVDAFGSDFLAP